jgi:hypothetical protein
MGEPEPERSTVLKRFTTRQAERRADLARQSWPEFFRGLAVETAVVAVLLLVALLVIWLFRG